MKSIVIVSAGLGEPSTTRLLADRFVSEAHRKIPDARVEIIELRSLAHPIIDAMLTQTSSPELAEAVRKVTNADGLVAITPAAGYVSGVAPIAIGLVAGVVCCYAVRLKHRFGYDDALDVVGVHFVGGLVGSLLIGFFANPGFFEGSFEEGIFYGGDAGLLIEQALANGAAIVWSFVLTFVIMVALKKTIGVRVSEEAEAGGLDISEHGETAYHGGR